MKRALLLLAVLTMPTLASAQPGGYPPSQPYSPYAQPPPPPPPPPQQPYAQPYAQPQPYRPYYAQPSTLPGGFWDRGGRLVWGLSLGLGAMSSNDGPIKCASCDYSPLGFEVDAHVGGMLSHRLALMLEMQVNGQTVEVVGGGEGDKTLVQFAVMAAAQYWMTPRLWVKGGIGFGTLSYNYNDSFGSQEEPIDDGGSGLLSVGYEIASGRDFAIDLQGRYVVGTYDGIQDKISAATIGLGINWY